MRNDYSCNLSACGWLEHLFRIIHERMMGATQSVELESAKVVVREDQNSVCNYEDDTPECGMRVYGC